MLTTLRSPFRVFLCLLVLMSALTALYISTHIQARAEGIPASTTQANWPQWQYDAAHSGFNPNEKTLSPSNISQLTLAWQFTGKVSKVSSPIVANGVVYFIEGQYLYGRDALAGARKMTKVVNGFATPSFSNGLLYIGISTGLMAINAKTSQTVWQFTGSVFTDPVVAGTFVYFIGGTSGKLTLYALNAATGTLQWSYTYTQQGVASPAVANGHIQRKVEALTLLPLSMALSTAIVVSGLLLSMQQREHSNGTILRLQGSLRRLLSQVGLSTLAHSQELLMLSLPEMARSNGLRL